MRFKKGTKVEVLKNTEVPSGSWWCAEIISGNGHNYHVRFLIFPDDANVERVPRKAIRPLPPPSGSAENWVPGDIAEVFDNCSWKIAKVLKVMGEHYFVRLLGSSREFQVHKLNLRVRQSWQDNQWVVIGKKSSCHLSGIKTKDEIKQDVLEQGSVFQEKKVQNMVTSRKSVKRGRDASYHFEENAGPHQKLRAIKKEGRLQQLVPRHESNLLDEVDAVASPQIMLGEKYMHASFNNRTTRFSEIETEESRNFNVEVGCCFSRSLEPIHDAEGSTSSVASCSSTTHVNSYKLPCHYVRGPSQDNYSDDAESSSSGGWVDGRDSSFPQNEEVAAEIHKLELHAYRSTMEALYASGPLSWEQEEMMTNLRLSLNISNDEHLLELRHLVSTS